jgi:FAD/FMN-containing dehydrogenase
MGGYDGQTVAGAISTSTHGSGAGLGPLSDSVRSLDVVASGGAVMAGNRCLVTTRNRTRPPVGGQPTHRRSRNSVPEFVATLPVTLKLLNLVLDRSLAELIQMTRAKGDSSCWPGWIARVGPTSRATGLCAPSATWS